MNQPEIKVEEVQSITPHNKALYEAGKKMLVDSVDVGREFCKFMTTTTLGAIPIYLALLNLVISRSHSIQSYDEVIFLAPPISFLLSSVLFIFGYFPQKETISLDLPQEIEKARSKTIGRRRCYSIWAFLVFCTGVVCGSWILVSRLLVR